MDTTKEYIEMCEKATEVQGKYCSKFGDFNYIDNMDAVQIFGCSEAFHNSIIWLPRQDQLQDMLELTVYDRICDKLYKFTEWVKINATYERSNCSMEQLWLAFVMSEKFGKVWTGKEWHAENNAENKKGVEK